jgi:hypothetical protein
MVCWFCDAQSVHCLCIVGQPSHLRRLQQSLTKSMLTVAFHSHCSYTLFSSSENWGYRAIFINTVYQCFVIVNRNYQRLLMFKIVLVALIVHNCTDVAKGAESLSSITTHSATNKRDIAPLIFFRNIYMYGVITGVRRQKSILIY